MGSGYIYGIYGIIKCFLFCICCHMFKLGREFLCMVYIYIISCYNLNTTNHICFDGETIRNTSTPFTPSCPAAQERMAFSVSVLQA